MRRSAPAASMAVRHMTEIRSRMVDEDIPQSVRDNIREFPMTTLWAEDSYEYTTPVTSAHMIEGDKVSTLDSVAISPDGSVIHGRYGPIPEPAASSIPLEFLALLRPAAEGAAAIRFLNEKAGGKKGTVLIYGVSMAPGMAAAQIANAEGHAVVGVISSHHSGNDDFGLGLKHMLDEPGTAVPEEYAYVKSKLRELVKGVVTGDEGYSDVDGDKYLEDFKDLFVKYCEFYPDTRPAAVKEEDYAFSEDNMGKDKEFWDINMEAYLSQFPPGAPPADKAKLDALFTKEQFEIFRQKFWKQTTALICDDDKGGDCGDFSPPHLVQSQIRDPEPVSKAQEVSSGFPFRYSMLNKENPKELDAPVGGKVIGAVICFTPELAAAANAVAAAKTLREKAEALEFVTKTEKQAFLAARSVIQNADGAPVLVLGGKLPGMDSVETTDADVKTALSAFDMDDAGKTKLNYFVQSYRASDFPFYAAYAIHRANEILAGPRQIVVLK
eukprot:CAMPEP_0172447420 /NCGR_PEP_ID=MMETSP1065-20121228/6738_1 /TAXON_ID=265537 /ORGANISM="Amphiprora paludosa, Strain CCMP125" /LENGTH=495 /DNA_ID=CAMNT_0013198721 /DNA_START=134 /DNA_END=1621 /DNA_ORIENTATION=+